MVEAQMRSNKDPRLVDRLLDGKGYVRLLDWLGSDLSVVNAARVSFHKESDWEYHEGPDWDSDGPVQHPALKERDQKLIRYLATHGHTSPFRSGVLQFEVKAPLMVCWQWEKHVVASLHLDEQHQWNQVSRRYVTEEPEFYVPAKDQWRAAPEQGKSKQGSGAPIEPEWDGYCRTLHLQEVIKFGMLRYKLALLAGVCSEQARLFLPAYSLYTTWRWTTSLQALAHFIALRQHEGAQAEIREYATVVHDLALPKFPVSLAALLGETT